jgi:microcin C transport system substrate-binding protein
MAAGAVLLAGHWFQPVLAGGGGQDAATGMPLPELVDLDDIVWETNLNDPPIGSLDAIRGSTFNDFIGSYPLTFRLMGPNSNDAFAGWNRAFTMYFGLVRRHPVTDNFIPWMATHWSVQDDQRTIYFKLDPDARFSDGERVTADDYVFTWRMMQSDYIVDPFYNTWVEQNLASVDRVDDYTLRIVGTRPSWRPLWDYAHDIWPTPSHAVMLDEDWVTRTTNEYQVAVGPYVVSDAVRGESVTFERVDDWWGDGKKYFQGLYNVERIHLVVIAPERALDYIRRGELDMMFEGTARTWNEEYTFEAVRNGWMRRARVFLDMPSGIMGLHMNLEAPIFQNKDFRKAMQHLFNFERLNRNLMYNEYFRQVSFFEGSEYASPDLESYDFDPTMARDYLRRAGYRRPVSVTDPTLFGRITNTLHGLLFTRSRTASVIHCNLRHPRIRTTSHGHAAGVSPSRRGHAAAASRAWNRVRARPGAKVRDDVDRPHDRLLPGPSAVSAH